MNCPLPAIYLKPERAGRIALIAKSHELLLGHRLFETGDDVITALWSSPFAIVAHGTQADPVFFFGNAAALAVFETDAEAFIGMPSRLSAEAPLRGERQALLDRVMAKGFIDDYAGIRISAKGRRFHIGPATVWNLVDEAGLRHGQAACFVP